MPYKVVQITDTHLFETPAGTQKGVNTYQTLEAVVKDVAAGHAGFDALLLTGDLSQDESPGSYELLKELLAPVLTAPAHAIPGNHDNLRHMQDVLAGDGISVGRDLRLGPWRFALLNSQVPGRVHGELGTEQIEGLGESLLQDEHVMVVLHHPPVAVNSAWIDASRCLDGDALLAALTAPPVEAIVCGHVHQAFEDTRNCLPILTTPSTCVQFKPGIDDFAIDEEAAPGYRTFELEDDGRWSTAVHRIGTP